MCFLVMLSSFDLMDATDIYISILILRPVIISSLGGYKVCEL